MRPRTHTIPSPDCETAEIRCPYLDDGQCWGVDDQDTKDGYWRTCVDHGEGTSPRYGRHVECPAGTRTMRVGVRT